MTTPHYEDGLVTIWHGDCLDVLRTLPDASVHAVVTDPPYALEFMGHQWDSWDSPADFEAWCAEWATECLRILKPGGHLLAFGGSRTWHRLAAGIEDAGFDVRDSIAWLYGSGFPKSLDVSKAIDAAAGAARDVVGRAKGAGSSNTASLGKFDAEYDRTTASTDDAKAWEGWGTALKPSFEPIVVGRKPIAGTVAANVLAHGTGALNIDATRIATKDDPSGGAYTERSSVSGSLNPSGMNVVGAKAHGEFQQPSGRWPTNVVLDESQAAALDEQTGILNSGTTRAGTERQARAGGTIYGADQRNFVPADTYGGSGGASRFFPTFRYEAKAPSSERPKAGEVQHPTVKPLDLMRWLVRLVTPPDGVVLEPFAGAGTTVEAALLEGFRCIAIEREADYLPLIEQRITKPLQQSLFGDWDDAA